MDKREARVLPQPPSHGTVGLNSPLENETLSLERASELVRSEDVAGAEHALRVLEKSGIQGVSGHRLDVLRAELFLLKREYGNLSDFLRMRETKSLSPSQRIELDIIGAHGEALVGEATKAFRQIARVLRSTNKFEGPRARSSWVAGVSCYRSGHYKWARHFFEASLSFYRLSSDHISIANLLVNLSLIDKSEGKIAVALSRLDEAFSILPKVGHVTLRTRMLINRSICFLKIGRTHKARASLMQAKALAKQRDGASFTTSICNNLGHIFHMQGNLQRATEFHLAALKESSLEGSPRKQCLALEFLGEVATEVGALEDADQYLTRAFTLARVLAPQGDLMMEVLRRQGELQAKRGTASKALATLRKALSISKSRKEIREHLLTRRAILLLTAAGDERSAEEAQSILAELQSIGDRFEYGRTVCLLMETGKFHRSPWIERSKTTAVHYLESIDCAHLADRLARSTGHAKKLDLPSSDDDDEPQIDSKSPRYRRCLETIDVTSRGTGPVLILGDTGTGKELFAKQVHAASPRRNQRLVAINCAALPENLVESELFGHAKGTFTGAHRDKEGLIEAANKGSLFLDEIGDLPLSTQVKLLRFLDSGEFRRVGDTRTRQSDVRVIAATNRDIEKQVMHGDFRRDLYFRLSVFRISIPPLRFRREDILSLTRQFLPAKGGPSEFELSEDLREWLAAYPWPGNVRELRNMCEYLEAKAWGKAVITMDDLPQHLLNSPDTKPEDALPSSLARERLDLERNQIILALNQTQGHIQEAAQLLGMGRNTVTRRMAFFGLSTRNILTRKP